jgi:hypothetical protein
MRALVDHLRAIENRTARDNDLLAYHLKSLAHATDNDSDRLALAAFVAELKVG